VFESRTAHQRNAFSYAGRRSIATAFNSANASSIPSFVPIGAQSTPLTRASSRAPVSRSRSSFGCRPPTPCWPSCVPSGSSRSSARLQLRTEGVRTVGRFIGACVGAFSDVSRHRVTDPWCIGGIAMTKQRLRCRLGWHRWVTAGVVGGERYRTCRDCGIEGTPPKKGSDSH
jgi:hypothetical protein